LKKYFGNRETIFPPARKKAEASRALSAGNKDPK